MKFENAMPDIKRCSTAAIGQRSVFDASCSFPLLPASTAGVSTDLGDAFISPVEVVYDYTSIDLTIFDQIDSGRGIDQWSMLLPPLVAGAGLGEGATALVEMPSLADWGGIKGRLYVKDESRNPTWSHKDRLNRCTISAARLANAPGVVVASSGNHGASAAAYSARMGLPCIVLASSTAPRAMQSFVSAYGGIVLAVPPARRWALLRSIVERLGFHPVSNMTDASHTGHAFGTEGYKTIAYELFIQLGRIVPAAVLIPTGYGEMAYGVWKGFVELKELGLASSLPRIFVCESASYGAHERAVRMSAPAMTITPGAATDALSIAVEVGGHRAVAAITRSGGAGILLTDGEMRAAQKQMAQQGLWAELSAAASAAALHKLPPDLHASERPIVCISTSSGFKDVGVGDAALSPCDGSWEAFVTAAHAQGLPIG